MLRVCVPGAASKRAMQAADGRAAVGVAAAIALAWRCSAWSQETSPRPPLDSAKSAGVRIREADSPADAEFIAAVSKIASWL